MMFRRHRDKDIKNRLRELENVLEGIAAPMFVTDQDLKIVRINDPALRVTGYRRDEVVGRMTCGALSRTPLCGTENCTIRNCMRTGQPLIGETVLTARDGRQIPIAASCSALFDEGGRACGGIEVIVDRTVAVRLQRETEMQRKRLEEGVKAVCDVMEAAAAKDLTRRVEAEMEGELSVLKESVNRCLQELAISLSQVTLGAEQVTSAASQISSGSQTLSEGASRQAGSLEEISSSLQEMSSIAMQNAANAKQVRGLSDAACSAAQRGTQSMRRLSESIQRIKSSSDSTARIIKTIDEIAFQTNLLALNAAVEAARAGDAGRGFAVVAEEVRNLAIRSADAAKNTSALIEESVRNAQDGVQVNQEVTTNLEEISGQIQKVNELIGEITQASEQQSARVKQIDSEVGQVNQVTQQVAGNAEESASAAEELRSQAEEMRQMVFAFQLPTDAQRSGTATRAEHLRVVQGRS